MSEGCSGLSYWWQIYRTVNEAQKSLILSGFLSLINARMTRFLL